MPMLDIAAHDGGSFSAYVARPTGTGPFPAVLLIQEIFGVNRVMRDLCDQLAAKGYLAVCPDLFWRQEPNIQLTDQSEAHWARAFELYKGFDETLGVKDLIASLAAIRHHPDCNGKVATQGYCLGGKLAYLMACHSDADANISYYGVGIEGALDAAANIHKPTLLHIAELDKFVAHDAQEAIIAALSGNDNVTIYRYRGCDHAFARQGGAHYDAMAANLANGRSADFLKQYLI